MNFDRVDRDAIREEQKIRAEEEREAEEEFVNNTAKYFLVSEGLGDVKED